MFGLDIIATFGLYNKNRLAIAGRVQHIREVIAWSGKTLVRNQIKVHKKNTLMKRNIHRGLKAKAKKKKIN